MSVLPKCGVLFAFGLFAIVNGLAPIAAWANPDLVETGRLLAVLLDAGRGTVAANQSVINDAGKGTRDLHQRCSKRVDREIQRTSRCRSG